MAPHKGFKHSAEAREKIRTASIGRRHTVETRDKLSAIFKGKLRGPKTEAQRVAHLEGMRRLRGKPRSEAVKAKISATLMGHEGPTEEVRKIMSDKARSHAVVNLSGGQEGVKFAEVLCPLGYTREHYVYYGEQIIPFGASFRRRFIRLDFAHIEAKIDIELDGSYHDEPEQTIEDERRDAILYDLGWHVFRVKHGSVLADVKALAAEAKLGRFPG